MLVKNWIAQHKRQLVTVQSDAPVEEVISAMLSSSGLRDVYVTNQEDQLIGHISHKKLAEFALMIHRPIHTHHQLIDRVVAQTASDLMTGHLYTAQEDEQLDDVVFRQLDQELEDMPVLDSEGREVGVLNLTELIRYFARQANRVE